MKKKILIIIVIIAVVAGGVLFINLKKGKQTEVKEVIAKKAEVGTFTNSVDVEGDIEIKNQKEIYVSKS